MAARLAKLQWSARRCGDGQRSCYVGSRSSTVIAIHRGCRARVSVRVHPSQNQEAARHHDRIQGEGHLHGPRTARLGSWGEVGQRPHMEGEAAAVVVLLLHAQESDRFRSFGGRVCGQPQCALACTGRAKDDRRACHCCASHSYGRDLAHAHNLPIVT